MYVCIGGREIKKSLTVGLALFNGFIMNGRRGFSFEPLSFEWNALRFGIIIRIIIIECTLQNITGMQI